MTPTVEQAADALEQAVVTDRTAVFPLRNKMAMLVSFWALQAAAAVCFKYGSTADALWWPMFWTGHAFGVASIVIIMALYRRMNANVALGLCVGGGFLASQISMAVLFNSVLSPVQWAGMIAITGGMMLLAFGGEKTEPELVPVP